MKIAKSVILLALSVFVSGAYAQKIDYSAISVSEENGIDFTQITTNTETVCYPEVKRNKKEIKWTINRFLAVSPDGKNIAYLSARDRKYKVANIFVKDVTKQGASMQRTNRTEVFDFSFSPDGSNLVFSENRGLGFQIFVTDANKGSVCQQITSGSNDLSPIYSPDMKYIYFARVEGNSYGIWSFDIGNNMLASYTQGSTLYPIGDVKDGKRKLLCTRESARGDGEIWEMDFTTGTEKCLIAELGKSFATPMLSPDGRWILFSGSSIAKVKGKSYRNVDIYVASADGTKIMQMTYHPADDLSPVWSADGRSIYFISLRGSAEKKPIANVWRMNFVETKY